jgi:hypothetical protein
MRPVAVGRDTRGKLVLVQVGADPESDFFAEISGTALDRSAAIRMLPRLFPDGLDGGRRALLAKIMTDLGIEHRGSDLASSRTVEELRAALAERLRRNQVRIVIERLTASIPLPTAADVAPPPPPPPPAKTVPCALRETTITCQHDSKRKPSPEGVLEVVAAEGADTITLTSKVEASCDKHPEWHIITPDGDQKVKEAETTVDVKAWGAGSGRWLEGVNPKLYSVGVKACSGQSKLHRIRAYPKDKFQLKLSNENWSDLFGWQTAVNKALEAAWGAKKPFKFTQGAVTVEAQWSEAKDWRAFYKYAVNVGCDPLINTDQAVATDPAARRIDPVHPARSGHLRRDRRRDQSQLQLGAGDAGRIADPRPAQGPNHRIDRRVGEGRQGHRGGVQRRDDPEGRGHGQTRHEQGTVLGHVAQMGRRGGELQSEVLERPHREESRHPARR